MGVSNSYPQAGHLTRVVPCLPIPAQAERDRANTVSSTNEIILFMLSPPFILVSTHTVIVDQKSHSLLRTMALLIREPFSLSGDRTIGHGRMEL